MSSELNALSYLGKFNALDYFYMAISPFGTGDDAKVDPEFLRIYLANSTETWIASVRVASTANGTLATAFENGDTIDGVVLATGDRILLKDQTDATENGPYTVEASGAPTRATDYDNDSEISPGDLFYVQEGTAGRTVWELTSAEPHVPDTNDMDFTRFYGKQDVLIIDVGDETTTITTGTAKKTFRMPYAFNLHSVRASLGTVSSSGIPTFDINEGGTTILSTKLTIDANEKTSTTAATAAVISDTALADDAEMTIDIDVAGTGAAGAKIYLIGARA